MKGQTAISLAGRDKGRMFLIVDILDENHVAIADGQLRKIDKPKRKKLKHLKLLEAVMGIPSTNKELKEMLAELSQS